MALNAKPAPDPLQKETDLSEALLKLANVGGKIGRERAERDERLVINSGMLEKQLLENARAGNRAAFAWSVQQFCELDFRKTLDIIENQDAGLLATLLIALGIKKIAACQLLLLLNRSIGRNADVFRAISKQLEKLDPDACKAVFEKMGARFSGPDPVPPVPREEKSFTAAIRERRNSLLHSRPVQNIQVTFSESTVLAG